MPPLVDDRSGIHLTGEDSGWPVGDDPTWPYRYSEADEPFLPHADAIDNGLLYFNERVVLSVAGTGGTYTLGVDGEVEVTDPIAPDATPTEIAEQLEGLPAIGVGNVEVTGGPGNANGDVPYFIEFVGDLGHTDVPALVSDHALITGGGAVVTVNASVDGSPA